MKNKLTRKSFKNWYELESLFHVGSRELTFIKADSGKYKAMTIERKRELQNKHLKEGSLYLFEDRTDKYGKHTVAYTLDRFNWEVVKAYISKLDSDETLS